MIKHVTDVKLNVKPIFVGFEHKYYYEGPCRMAGGEAIEPGYDGMVNGMVYKGFIEGLKENFGKNPFLNIMEPSSTTCTDDWDITDAQFESLLADERDVDVYIAVGGFGTSQIYEEFCIRAKHPVIPVPENMFGPLTSVGPRNFGADIIDCYDWGEVVQALRVLRAQKVLASANILLAPRFGSTKAKAGGTDTFRDLTAVTDKLGTHFRTISVHELMDQMMLEPEEGNHTTPGRKTPNITKADIDELEKTADEIMSGAEVCCIDKKFVVNSLIAWRTVQKNMDLYDCMGFVAPCPDMCSTRRLNKQQFTMCFNHSLNLEQGIASACEYDVTAAECMLLQMSLSNSAAYMGNTIPIVANGEHVNWPSFITDEEKAKLGDPSNLYTVFHSTTCRKLHGFTQAADKYALRHFAYDAKFGAIFRHDFDEDDGQTITFTRMSGDLKKILIGKGRIVASIGYDSDNCNGGFVFEVEDARKLFHAQMQTGSHLVYTYGDITDDLKMFAKRAGFEVLAV